MFRQAIRRCATATIPQASARSLQYPTRSISPIIKSKTFATPAIKSSFIRCYSAHAGLNKDEIQGRILDLLKNFDKVCHVITHLILCLSDLANINLTGISGCKGILPLRDCWWMYDLTSSAERNISLHKRPRIGQFRYRRSSHGN